MAIERPRLIRRIEFAVMVITLMVMATGLGCLMFITAGHAADEPDSDTRKMLARLAWMSLALLALVVVVLAWLVIRHAALRLRERKTKPAPTPYVNSWALAGKRIQIPPDAPETLADLGIGEDDDSDEGPDTTRDDEPADDPKER